MSDGREVVVIEPNRSAVRVSGAKYFALSTITKSIITKGFTLGVQNILGYGVITGFNVAMFAYAPAFRTISSLTTHLAFMSPSSPALSAVASTLGGIGANAIIGFFIWKGLIIVTNVIRGNNADLVGRKLNDYHKGEIPRLPRPSELD